MKFILSCCGVLLLHSISLGQQPLLQVKDTAAVKIKITDKKNVTGPPVAVAVENELNKIVAAYAAQPNTAATWVQIKSAAENILHTWFMNGKLLGAKKEQAYYVKMGTETMTAADIANKKMILLAGIATVKPAEFAVIRVEKNCAR